jgi:hypothetical protein
MGSLAAFFELFCVLRETQHCPIEQPTADPFGLQPGGNHERREGRNNAEEIADMSWRILK